MNLRQKKKLFKKMTGNNPPKWMKLSGKEYHKTPEKKKYTKPEIISVLNKVFKGRIRCRFEPEEINKTVEETMRKVEECLYKGMNYAINTENMIHVTQILTRNRRIRKY